jgi:SAM-dependent methyltransferase
MKINIGAGDVKYEDYVTIDHDELSSPDHVVDLEKENLPFQDSTVEAVIAHHILEHLGEGYFHCLQELYRVCKHGAIIDIKVPHPRHDAFLADPTHKRPITVMGFRLFSRKFNSLCKEQGFPSSRLGDYYKVDFELVDFKYIPDEKIKQSLAHLDLDQLNEYADQHNNIISEIHIKLVVIKNEQ